MKKSQGQKAWLILWDWDGSHAAVEDKLVAILRPRLHSRIVEEIVQCLYAVHAYTGVEMAAWSKRPKENPYQPQWEAGICHLGHNPFLTAQKVHDLVIRQDPESCFETISYKLPECYTFSTATGKPELVREAKKESFTRSIIGPLSHREIGRL